MPARKPIKIMLLDDHPVMLHGLQSCLANELDIHIAGSYSSAQALLAALSLESVDLIVLDYSLGPDEVDGLNLIRALKIRFPTIRLLVISAAHNSATVAMTIRGGADGFIGKEVDLSQLPIAIRRVASGKQYLVENMIQLLHDNEIYLNNKHSHSLPNETSSISVLINNSKLTAREYEVLRCCLDGQSVSQIAQKFSRSIKTISTQKQSAFRKLGLNNDSELYKIRDQLDIR
ncbi:DNA-binding response regulator [Pseudomonas fluorescens]|nr:DNA-binding response regulator [Pseudomonas fluorescens]